MILERKNFEANICIQTYLFGHDKRFFDGWYLDTSFKLCTASWVLLVLISLGITASAYYLEEEGGYELIPNVQMETEQDEM
jgi:hypothetical protein